MEIVEQKLCQWWYFTFTNKFVWIAFEYLKTFLISNWLVHKEMFEWLDNNKCILFLPNVNLLNNVSTKSVGVDKYALWEFWFHISFFTCCEKTDFTEYHITLYKIHCIMKTSSPYFIMFMHFRKSKNHFVFPAKWY